MSRSIISHSSRESTGFRGRKRFSFFLFLLRRVVPYVIRRCWLGETRCRFFFQPLVRTSFNSRWSGCLGSGRPNSHDPGQISSHFSWKLQSVSLGAEHSISDWSWKRTARWTSMIVWLRILLFDFFPFISVDSRRKILRKLNPIAPSRRWPVLWSLERERENVATTFQAANVFTPPGSPLWPKNPHPAPLRSSRFSPSFWV